jgi:carbonic anhydrase/acetyltransferase-like protein (isoleucine patch superfamily)
VRAALLLPHDGVWPDVAEDAFLAPGAVIIGNVKIGAQSSVWFGAVLRGDHPANGIVVGARSNVQDGCVIHVGDWRPTVVGSDCTIGHGAKFESCVIGDGCTVGMNAVILQEAVIGERSIVAAGAVVLERTEVPPLSLVAGVPAKVRKSLEGSASRWITRASEHYVARSRRYLEQGIGRVADAAWG